MQYDLDTVRQRLAWMRREGIWPNGLRYLWTDAFGLVLFCSLARETKDPHWLDEARWLVDEVERVLGRTHGLRIGEAEDRDGQYYHYLAMWLFALARLGEFDEQYRERGVALARDIHSRFLVRGQGMHWKMKEDLSAPYPGFGLGALDVFSGYVAYHQLDERALRHEIADCAAIMSTQYQRMTITQDLALGMMLWNCHFHPDQDWARLQRRRCLDMLAGMWQPAGYFCRQPGAPAVTFAFTNYGVAIGLQAVDAMPDRVTALIEHFWDHPSGDSYDREAITHVMACCAVFPGLLLSHQMHGQQAGTQAP